MKRREKEPAWKSKPELCATCRTCKEVFPLGFNFCPDCGKALTRRRIGLFTPEIPGKDTC